MPRFTLHPLPALVAAALACPATGALAQQASPAEAVLPEVRVRGKAERADGPVKGYRATRSSTFTRTDTPLKEVPASVTVVPQEVIRDTAMQSLGDVFRYVPGATAHQGEGNRDQVVLRGTSTTADFYADGVRDDAQVFRDLYNLERVEVLKGPGGMAFGRGGAGGVVNRVTKRPAFGHVGEASLTLGSWSQRRGTADLGDKLGDSGAWRLNAMAEKSGSFRGGVELERYAVNPAVTLLPGPQTALTLGYEHLRDSRTADRGFPSRNGAPFDADPSTFFGDASQSRARSTVDSLYAVVEHDFGGGLHLKNTSRLVHYDKRYQNVFPGSAVNAAGNLALSAYNNANDRTNFFNQTDLTAKFSTGGMEHSLLAGVELGRQRSASRRNTGFFGAATGITVPASAPLATATDFRQTATDADNLVRSETVAAYLQDHVSLSAEWKVIAGVRYDLFKVALDDRRSLAVPLDLARSDNALSPRAGVVWTPTAGSAYYLAYSYAFLPSGEQLGLAATTASLDPEKARNYEAGARWDLTPRLALSAAIFRTDRDNVRVADPANPGFFVKTGQQRTDGLELGLQGEVRPWWRVYGGYAHLDARVIQPLNTGTAATVGSIVPAGNRLGLVPEDAISLWNRFDIDGGWSTGVGVIHQSSAFASISNNVRLPAFTRLDGALFYTFSGGARLALNIENLLDRDYFPTSNGDNNISPGATRTVRLTLALDL